MAGTALDCFAALATTIQQPHALAQWVQVTIPSTTS
jgi:hypothetical protein